MKSQYLREPVNILSVKPLMLALSILFLIAFGWLDLFWYSVITTSFYMMTVLLSGYDKGSKDIRKISTTPPYPLKGFVLSVISELPTLLLLLTVYVLQGSAYFSVYNIIYIIWNLPFLGFLGLPSQNLISMTSINLYYILPSVFIITGTGIGYILGYKKVSFLEKLIYNLTYKKTKK